MGKWLKTSDGVLINLDKVTSITGVFKDRQSDRYVINAFVPGIAVNSNGDEVFDHTTLFSSTDQAETENAYKFITGLIGPVATFE